VDSQGDRIESGAFAEDNGKEVPLLWSHKRDEPVGIGRLENTPDGVLLKGKLDLDTQAGREAYSRLRKGVVKGLSIGLQLLQHVYDGAVRVIRKGTIREVSLVLFPANPEARVLAAKGEESSAAELLRYC
jgi:HK97 family phage prohead protease